MSQLPESGADGSTSATENLDEAAREHRRSLPDASPSARTLAPLAPGLYVVSTPIGNLEDITLRAIRVLREVDRIGCEDTRQTQKLLNHFGVKTPTVSLHRHNEHQRSEELLGSLEAGARIALVSDAGTPGIADPGAELISRAIAADVPVYVVPGPSAVLGAVIGSGMAPPETGAFRFHGFLPARSGERRTALEELRLSLKPQLEVFYEAPHRLLDTLADVETVLGAAQRVGMARELTKVHEEFLRGSVAELRAELGSRAVLRGEIVLLLPMPGKAVQTATENPADTPDLRQEVRDLMSSEKLTEMDAIKRVAKRRGLGKSEVYREWQRSRRS